MVHAGAKDRVRENVLAGDISTKVVKVGAPVAEIGQHPVEDVTVVPLLLREDHTAGVVPAHPVEHGMGDWCMQIEAEE